LWECPTYFGATLAEIAALADTVYVSFYKSLGGLSGAALAGPADLIADAKVWRHRYGGQLYAQFPAIVAALEGLDHELPRLPSYVKHAGEVAATLGETFAETLPWFRVHPDPPHTHQFAVWLPFPADALADATLRLEEETRTSLFRRWADTDLPGVAKTEVTVSAPALDWTAADVAAATRQFVSYLAIRP
jgi:threonine aldolase